jgi:hypothetical protein
MSSPNSSALHSTHSRRGGHGGHPGGCLGSILSGSVGTRHSPSLGKRSAGVASAATTRQGRGAGAVSPMAMAYSTPARSLTFSKVLATSQEHSVSSLSQSQSLSAARREGDAHPLKVGGPAQDLPKFQMPCLTPKSVQTCSIHSPDGDCKVSLKKIDPFMTNGCRIVAPAESLVTDS